MSFPMTWAMLIKQKVNENKVTLVTTFHYNTFDILSVRRQFLQLVLIN